MQAFLTHGGQNSFNEALAYGTPLLVCPGFGDQPMNAAKAVRLGVGLKVDKPVPEPGQQFRASSDYRRDVSDALNRLLTETSFQSSAAGCAERLQRAGGTARAVKLILSQVTRVLPNVAHKARA